LLDPWRHSPADRANTLQIRGGGSAGRGWSALCFGVGQWDRGSQFGELLTRGISEGLAHGGSDHARRQLAQPVERVGELANALGREPLRVDRGKEVALEQADERAVTGRTVSRSTSYSSRTSPAGTLFLLRWAARQIVVIYAEACGWLPLL